MCTYENIPTSFSVLQMGGEAGGTIRAVCMYVNIKLIFIVMWDYNAPIKACLKKRKFFSSPIFGRICKGLALILL